MLKQLIKDNIAVVYYIMNIKLTQKKQIKNVKKEKSKSKPPKQKFIATIILLFENFNIINNALTFSTE